MKSYLEFAYLDENVNRLILLIWVDVWREESKFVDDLKTKSDRRNFVAK